MAGTPTNKVNLVTQADQSGSLEEEETKAKILGIKSDIFLRIIFVTTMVVLFIMLNIFIIELIKDSVARDAEMIKCDLIKPTKRLVTENVYISLIAGTVAQLGTVMVAMAHYFFPKDGNSKN